MDVRDTNRLMSGVAQQKCTCLAIFGLSGTALIGRDFSDLPGIVLNVLGQLENVNLLKF